MGNCGQATISVHGLWKVFGPAEHRIIGTPDAELSPAELVAAEREILLNLDDIQSKPAEMREKIVEGRLSKSFFGESVLGEQTWIHDTSLNVNKALAQAGFELVDYAWYSVG